MNPPRFQFDGYTVRPIEDRDRAYLDQLIDADPYHRGKMTADFFFKDGDGWALEDEKGQIVFYFKTRAAVRMFIQFPPVAGLTERLRNHVAMLKGMRWIERRFAANGFREVICDTEGPELGNFLKRRLGFEEATTLARWLPTMPNVPKIPPQPCATVANGESGGEVIANVRSQRAGAKPN